MGLYKVNPDGWAPKGLKEGDRVVTGGGVYEITEVRPDGSYQSVLVGTATPDTYKGGYDKPPEIVDPESWKENGRPPGLYKVNPDGRAPKGLKKGDRVVTGGGVYEITEVKPDGSYSSDLVGTATTDTYKGGYDKPPGISDEPAVGGENEPQKESGVSPKFYYDEEARRAKEVAQRNKDEIISRIARERSSAVDLYNRQGRGAYVNSVLSQNKLKEVLAQNGLNTQGVAKTSQNKILGDYQDEARSIVREKADTLASLDRQEKQAKANYKDEAAKIDRDLRKKLNALK